uniref:HIT domain-containing protein n=1 Tax=Moniliophthora roreri TaxID=221103 RepID=A0A0W0F2Q1_MONRR
MSTAWMLVEDSERRRRKPVTTVTATTTWALTLCSSQHIPALPDDTADFYFESAGASRHTKLDSGFLGPEFDLGNFSRDSYPLQTPRLMIFSLCTLFPFISSNATASLDLESLELPHVKRCAFCDVTTENGFQIVWEDDTFVAFSDRNPACNLHIQLIPRRHIQSVKELTKSDAKLRKSRIQLENRETSADISCLSKINGYHRSSTSGHFIDSNKHAKVPLLLLNSFNRL